MTSSNQSKSGFGPIALIVAGVVCFAAGYLVNDLTKAMTQKVPEPKRGATAIPPDAPDAAPGIESPAEPKTDATPGEPEPTPPAGAGAPPPSL